MFIQLSVGSQEMTAMSICLPLPSPPPSSTNYCVRTTVSLQACYSTHHPCRAGRARDAHTHAHHSNTHPHYSLAPFTLNSVSRSRTGPAASSWLRSGQVRSDNAAQRKRRIIHTCIHTRRITEGNVYLDDLMGNALSYALCHVLYT